MVQGSESISLHRMLGKDKDYRYMATSDLLNELNKEAFKVDVDMEIKLCNIILQQLDDSAFDVSGLAVDQFWAISLVRHASIEE
ncbi:Cullin-associated NEDD8-dissociated protein 1-like protein [Drosera capensis]